VFIPFHYVYPTKTKRLRWLTVSGGSLWAVVMTWLALNVDEPWARNIAIGTAVYPLYYLALSAVHHLDHRRAERDRVA
jgi:hypothetical protein